ncbi:hypothetical protein ACFVW1_23620 [Streptomyces olivochromogenes]
MTRRQTWTEDSSMPRSASSGERSEAAKMPRVAITSRSRHW